MSALSPLVFPLRRKINNLCIDIIQNVLLYADGPVLKYLSCQYSVHFNL